MKNTLLLHIVQDLWQTHYQILSVIFLKEFLELNKNSEMMIKNVKLKYDYENIMWNIT